MENKKFGLGDWLRIICVMVMFFVGVYTTTFHILQWTMAKVMNFVELRRMCKQRDKKLEEQEDLEA